MCVLFLYTVRIGVYPRGNSLVVEAAAPAGGVAVLGEGVAELAVQLVGQPPRHALPGHDEDDDYGVGAVVAGPMPHQTQQLLRLTATTDHLIENNAARRYFRFAPREVDFHPAVHLYTEPQRLC